MARVVPRESDAAPTVYLGISGVMHPSESLYQLLHGRSAWDDGHSEYENAKVLERALEGWPQARIVLTSTQPWAHGLTAVLERLGSALASRVVSYTYDDLTSKVQREVLTRRGTTRTLRFSAEDYWRMSKAQIVAAHVEWSHPERWIAIDDEGILWPSELGRDRLVLTDGCWGLADAEAQDRLMTLLVGNFGPPAR